jgi:hypothetical protein
MADTEIDRVVTRLLDLLLPLLLDAVLLRDLRSGVPMSLSTPLALLLDDRVTLGDIGDDSLAKRELEDVGLSNGEPASGEQENDDDDDDDDDDEFEDARGSMVRFRLLTCDVLLLLPEASLRELEDLLRLTAGDAAASCNTSGDDGLLVGSAIVSCVCLDLLELWLAAAAAAAAASIGGALLDSVASEVGVVD